MAATVTGFLAAFVLLVSSAGTAGQRAAASFDAAGVPIHYVDRGQGPMVVLLHGFTGSSARHFEAPGVMDALEAAGYRVVAMDCRGHGQSGKPRQPERYGVEMVADVVRLLDHLGIERAHVVGYSMGGAIANHLLVRHPNRLLTATLLGAGWEGEDISALRTWMLALADGFAKRDATALIQAVTSGGTAPTPEQVAALNASMFSRNDPDVLAAVARGILPLFEVPRDALRAVTVPVLAIVGEHDRNIESVRRMAGVLPALEVVEIPGANHATSVRPSAAHIVAFLGKYRRD